MLDDDFVAELLSPLGKDDMYCQSLLELPLHDVIRQVQYCSSSSRKENACSVVDEST